MSTAVLSEQASDAQRYAHMARLFAKLCADHPTISKVRLARDAGAVAFGVTVDELQEGSRLRSVAAARQKIMAAAAHLIRLHGSGGQTSIRSIGSVFQRDHSTVQFAINRYADDVRRALKGN